MLTLEADELPKSLRSIPDPPAKIYNLGRPISSYDQRNLLAVVGSRRVSPYGRLVTERLVSELARAGVVIVSGLALGVDSIAHSTALASGGETIAVLPGGIKKIYPRSHEPLARKIISSGSIISEHRDDYQPREYDFLIRNRLVSGLCSGVLITEAAARSGSLNTARHALEQGRIVMAVPGNITSELSGGTNQLLKMGAVPVTEAADIFHALGWKAENSRKEASAYTKEEGAVIKILTGKDSLSGDELLVRSGLSSGDFLETMTNLEISGVIKPLGGNFWTLS